MIDMETAEGIQFQWHVGEPWPAHLNALPRRIDMLQADGDELNLVLARVKNVPIFMRSNRIHTAPVQTWFGDDARFIAHVIRATTYALSIYD